MRGFGEGANDNGDGSRYLFASDAKNYTWLGEETLREGEGKSRDRKGEGKNCNGLVTCFFFFFRSPHLSRGRRHGGRGGERILDRDVLPPSSPSSSPLSLRPLILLHFDVVSSRSVIFIIFFRLFPFFENSCQEETGE